MTRTAAREGGVRLPLVRAHIEDSWGYRIWSGFHAAARGPRRAGSTLAAKMGKREGKP
ncbi:hypothetical protein NITHO_2700002 [Nitrolancea hollandica Lb]|uniref:Uncharacterized protein n=1 Tax=Nitrolancea hollandica Lb TaxID=1129897 RepID=I4EGG1_9BACT|nr:hypothetical protein NITHO_2700002 [Nitrolancea hollandica Lb]